MAGDFEDDPGGCSCEDLICDSSPKACLTRQIQPTQKSARLISVVRFGIITMKTKKVVVSYPFSGSLYAYFESQIYPNRWPQKMKGHGYYQTLFGPKYTELSEISLTLSILYPEILIAPADNCFPDCRSHIEGGGYHNPDLGLSFSWDDFHESIKEIEERIIGDLEDQVISRILEKVPELAKKQILTYARYDLALSEKNDCPIICSKGRESLFKRLRTIDVAQKNDISIVQPNSVKFIEEYVNILGILFNPKSFDALYEVKSDKNVRKYSDQFLDILNKIGSERNPEKKFWNLINDAIETDSVAKNVSGIFDVSSIALGLLGFVETLGVGISIGSTIATGSTKLFGAISKRNKWYELGPEIKKVAGLHAIKKAISERKT